MYNLKFSVSHSKQLKTGEINLSVFDLPKILFYNQLVLSITEILGVFFFFLTCLNTGIYFILIYISVWTTIVRKHSSRYS